MFAVFNVTDGFYASPDEFESEAKAQEFIDAFPDRYKMQGYYRTGRCEKIDPKDVELMIVPVPV